VGDGRSCVRTLAQASFGHMRSDIPTTEPEQQSSFWWVCLHHSLQPQQYQSHLPRPPPPPYDQCIILAAQTAHKMRRHCPPNTRSFQTVIPKSRRINELHLRCLQRSTEKSKSLATRRGLHLHRKKKTGEHRSNTVKASNLLHFTEPSGVKALRYHGLLEIT